MHCIFLSVPHFIYLTEWCHWTASHNNDWWIPRWSLSCGQNPQRGERTVRASNNRRCEVMQRFILSAKSVFFRLHSGPILEGLWLVFTTSVWPSGHDCAHRDEYTHTDAHAWDRWGDTVPQCLILSCTLRSTHAHTVQLIDMHANITQKWATNQGCWTFAL